MWLQHSFVATFCLSLRTRGTDGLAAVLVVDVEDAMMTLQTLH